MANRINVILELDLTPLQRSLNRARRQMQQFSDTLTRAGTTLTESLTLPLAGLGAASVKAFADLDRLRKGMIAITGSADAADAELRKLREIAKLPGLNFEDAVQGSINLQAVGLSAEEARKTIQGFGTALAVTSRTPAEDLKEVQRQLTQIISKNRVLQEDYSVLQERIPLVGEAMQLAFGTRNIENVRALGVGGQEFVQRISQALAQLPQTQNVTGGLANAFENLNDSLRNSAAQFGDAINRALNLEGIINKLADAAQRAADWFSNLSPSMQRIIVIAAAVAAAIGPVLFIIGKLVAVVPVLITGLKGLVSAFTFLLSPIGLTIAAIGAVIAAIVIAYNKFEGFRRIVNGLGNAFKEVIQIFREAGAAFFEGFAALKEGDFRTANEKFKKAFTAGIPTEFFRQYGGRVKDAFAEGFADDTNYLKRVQDEFKKATSLTGGFAPSIPGAPTPTAAPGGGGGDPIGGNALESFQSRAARVFLNIRQSASQLVTSGIDKFVSQLRSVETVQSPLKATEEALNGWSKAMQLASDKSQVFGGERLTLIQEQINLTATALSTAVEQFGINSAAVEALTLKYAELTTQFEDLQRVQELGQAINNAFVTSFEAGAAAVNQAGATIKSVMKAIGRAALQSAADFAKAEIIKGVTSVIAKTLASAGPLGIFIAGAAGAAAGAIFQAAINGITAPKLARGGITTGETLAVVGDNPSGKEAIIPFERMGEFLRMAGGGQQVNVTGVFEVRGQDLVLVLDRANSQLNRVR